MFQPASIIDGKESFNVAINSMSQLQIFLGVLAGIAQALVQLG